MLGLIEIEVVPAMYALIDKSVRRHSVVDVDLQLP
jgi:hypothetical protein